MSRVSPPLSMTGEQRSTLDSLARSSTEPHRVVVRARALLMAADGRPSTEIADRCGVTAFTVRSWRTVFAERGLEKFAQVAAGRGRKPTIDQDTVRVGDAVYQAGGQDALVVPGHGPPCRGRQGHGGPDLVGPGFEAQSGGDIQAVERHEVRWGSTVLM